MARWRTPGWHRIASLLVRQYHRWSPVQRGKHWLLRHSSSFLMAPVSRGLWIRTTGVSGFEWKVFRGERCEVATAALFSSLLRPGMTVFDVGANVGYYSLLAARAVGEAGRVHAFEATPAVAERLSENVALNGIKNVSVNHRAVLDASGHAELRLQEDDSEGNSVVNYDEAWPAVRVPAVSLDDYVAERGIRRVHLLKIDVEGAEPLVIAGAEGILTGAQPPLVILELNPEALQAAGCSPAALVGRLTDLGYRGYAAEQLTQGPAAVWNLLAVHPAHGMSERLLQRHSLTPYRAASLTGAG